MNARAAGRRLFPHFAAWRHPRAEPIPVTLDRKRIYILPTGFGMGFALIEFVMLVGALNYQNNAALLLTCLLAAMTATSALLTFRNLDRLRLEAITGMPRAHAGQTVGLTLTLVAARRSRPGLSVRLGKATTAGITANGATTVQLTLPPATRGVHPIPPVRIATTWPFGMFRAWAKVHPAATHTVYPRLEIAGPVATTGRRGQPAARPRHAMADDDLAGLKEYVPGTPVKRVAWKASARHQTLLVRAEEHTGTDAGRTFQWQATAGLPYEERISRLARWVAEAHAAGRPWAMDIPGHRLAMAAGAAHYAACMLALARLPA